MILGRTIGIGAIVTALLLGACSSSESDTDVPIATAESRTSIVPVDPQAKILFIGNGFTFHRGGLRSHVPKLAASATPPLTVETHESVSGGATLEKHWNESSTPETIANGDFDLIVIQGDIPESDVATFQENARNLIAATRDAGAEPTLFMAWSYEGFGSITMDEIAHAHADIAEELDVDVAPVGLAFERASSERPELNMLSRDNVHPSIHGIHLTAYVIYMTIFGTDPPDNLTDLVEGDPITETDARFLHRIARATVTEYAANSTS